MGFPHVLFGTLREHYILLFGTAGGVAFLAGVIGAWIGARFGARAAVRRTLASAAPESVTRAEVKAVAEGLDALLLEVERIAEGQRFVAKLLAQRGERAGLPPGAAPARREPGQITPH